MSKIESARFAKKFEARISKVLKEMTLKTCCNYYRYPDQRSTKGGFANKQPADFFAVINKRFMNLECKTSIVEADFSKVFKGLISDHQMAAARKTNRTGAHYFFLFMSKFSGMIEVWDSRDLVEAYSTPRAKLDAAPRTIIDVKDDYTVWHSQLLRITLT